MKVTVVQQVSNLEGNRHRYERYPASDTQHARHQAEARADGKVSAFGLLAVCGVFSTVLMLLCRKETLVSSCQSYATAIPNPRPFMSCQNQ